MANCGTEDKKKTKETLLCPFCCVEYVEVEFDFEVDGIILHNVKALKCPSCQEEALTPEQQEEIMKKIST